jgi:hypothetical protein
MLARLLPIGNGLRREACLGVVVRQQFGLGRGGLGELGLQDLRNALVILLPCAPQQRLIGRILYQGMLKEVGRLGEYAALVEQFGLDKLCQPVLQCGLVQRRHGPEDLVCKLPPQHRSKLCHIFDCGQPVQPGHQRVLQGGRNRQGGQRTGQHIAPCVFPHQPRFENRLHQLFHKQRDAVGLGNNLMHHFGG